MTDIERARRRREEREPHTVRGFRCRACGYGASVLVLSVHPVTADEARLECPSCGAQDSEASVLPVLPVQS